jgi:hypothetical protein
VVQGHRAAKNTKDFAMLDAISEESITISIVKGIAPLVCLRLAGSGMAFFINYIRIP